MTRVFPVLVAALQRGHDDGDDDLVHVYCCDEDVSWCGQDISKAADGTNAPERDVCVVCVDMEDTLVFCRPGCPGPE